MAIGLLSAFALVLALQGCGGGGGSDEPAVESPPSMSGTVSDGVVFDTANYYGLDVAVKGSAGYSRVATAPPKVTTSYSVPLDKLDPPYLLSTSVLDGIALLAPATHAGTANLTPLTTLLTAWILGTEPSAFFDQTLNGLGGVPAFADADVAEAKAEVVRYLGRVTGVEITAAVVDTDWVTAPMQNAPGDPMFDQIVALNAALAANGSSLLQLTTEVAAQRERCNQASVTVSGSGLNQRFCQKDSSVQNADGIRTFSFGDVEGSTVSIRVSNGVVDQVSYGTREGTFACGDATACAGVTVGELGADDTVPITMAMLTLRSADGATVSLDGKLAGAGKLPSLPCTIDKLGLFDPDGSVQAFCLYEGSPAFRGSLQVYNWGTQNADPAYFLELVTDGNSVSSIDVWWSDPDTGNPVTLYRCVGGACAGVTLGDPADSVDGNGDPVRVRDITLNDVPLVAVDAAGQLGDTVVKTLTATLRAKVPLASTSVADCSASVEHNPVAFSDATPPIDVCPPPPSSPDVDSFKFASSYYDPDVIDAIDFSVSTYALEPDGTLVPKDTLHVVTSGETVLKAFLLVGNDSRTFSCVSSACTGITVSALDAQGRRTIAIDGLVLTEDPVRQLPANGVTATVTGGFVIAADPNFVPQAASRRRAQAAGLPMRHRDTRLARQGG